MKIAEHVTADLPTSLGRFRIWVWKGSRGKELVALTTPGLDPKREVMVRIHSECLTGDVFHSLTCDCEAQKDLALKRLQEHGNGIFIYHRQEGRNEGLFTKMQGYNLMREGVDTHEAYMRLVGNPDSREYSDTLRPLDVVLGGAKPDIRLLTNNPYKTLFLERHGYHVAAEQLRISPTVHTAAYTQTKTEKFLHGTPEPTPYVGITLLMRDLERASDIALLLSDLTFPRNRKLFIGVGIEDFSDESVNALNIFYQQLSMRPGLHIVVHCKYPARRAEERALRRYMEKLTFPCSLQFRLPDGVKSVDLEFVDSLHAQHVIFQLRHEDIGLLDDESAFKNYLQQPNHFLLLDESWGRGVKTSESTFRNHLLSLVSRGISRIAIAGGFDSARARVVTQLEDYFKIPISVDAEANLRTGEYLDVKKAAAYLRYFFSPQNPDRV